MVIETPVEMEMFVHTFTHEETVALVAEALLGKGLQWEAEAFEESSKGAANDAMIAMLRWGSKQLTAIAQLIMQIPPTELRAREKPAGGETAAPESIRMSLDTEQELGAHRLVGDEFIGGDHNFDFFASAVPPSVTATVSAPFAQVLPLT